jgi:hypothetical protein
MKWGFVLLVAAGICFMLFFVNALAEHPHEMAANVFALVGAICFLSALFRFGQALKKFDADRERQNK